MISIQTRGNYRSKDTRKTAKRLNKKLMSLPNSVTCVFIVRHWGEKKKNTRKTRTLACYVLTVKKSGKTCKKGRLTRRPSITYAWLSTSANVNPTDFKDRCAHNVLKGDTVFRAFSCWPYRLYEIVAWHLHLWDNIDALKIKAESLNTYGRLLH